MLANIDCRIDHRFVYFYISIRTNRTINSRYKLNTIDIE